MAPQLYALWAPSPVKLFGLVDVSGLDFIMALTLIALLSLFLLGLFVLHCVKVLSRTLGHPHFGHPAVSLSSYALCPSLVSKTSTVAYKELEAKDSCKPSTVEVDADTFRMLVEDRLQLHHKVNSLETSAASLRNRILFLEKPSKEYREDTGQSLDGLEDAHAAEKRTTADALTAERKTAAAYAAIVKERDTMAKEYAELRAQKDALAADLEALHTEMATATTAFSGGKTILDLEEKLTREAAKASRAASEVDRLQEELSVAKVELASKELTLDGMVDGIEKLVDMCHELFCANDEIATENKCLQAQLDEVRSSYSEVSDQLCAANASLALLQDENDDLNADLDDADEDCFRLKADLDNANEKCNMRNRVIKAGLLAYEDAISEVNRLKVALAGFATPAA
ncbi:hypothetical protein C8T65DRAFT_740223 [Cerioporus squamosus]|nr:hypothetical protein C8T65DRAFT_740223 [Cerioporus squamosus]